MNWKYPPNIQNRQISGLEEKNSIFENQLTDIKSDNANLRKENEDNKKEDANKEDIEPKE